MSRSTTLPARSLLPLLVAGLIGASVLAGCDSLLEKDPKVDLTVNTFFEDEEDAVQVTNATYEHLRDFQVHVFSWLALTDIVSDDATKGSTPTDASFFNDIDDLIFDPGNQNAFGGPWNGYFGGVYRANVALANIPPIEMDEELKARLIGENKFLRAYFYFFLVRGYGGVPLITEPLEPGEFEQPRASADEVYDLIVQDLQDAAAALPPSYTSADAGRITSGAAQGLLAKVQLFRGNFAEAQAAAEAVINSGTYALEPDYAFVFTPAGEFSSGSIFEVAAAALEAGGASTQYSQFQGVRGVPNLGFGFNQPSDALETSYEPGDPRQQATILYPWELTPDGSGAIVYFNTTIPNQRYNEKAQVPVDNPGGAGNSGVNIRRLRYADVLLIAAEAAARNGDEATAQDYLNQVRERARGGQAVTLGLTPERLADLIATENLGGASSSRVFVRYVAEGSGAAEAGLQGFTSGRLDDQEGASTPVLIGSMDIIESVNGTAVTTPADYEAALTGVSPDEAVSVGVLRATQQQTSDTTVATSTESLDFSVTAQALLPDVTASGQDLIDAIWRERRAELAMEQHRWYDIIRQGRAAELMEAAGKDFQERNRLFPIPQGEIDVTGGLLEQNPGY